MEREVHNEENKTPGDETGFGDEYKLKGKNCKGTTVPRYCVL